MLRELLSSFFRGSVGSYIAVIEAPCLYIAVIDAPCLYIAVIDAPCPILIFHIFCIEGRIGWDVLASCWKVM